jgi:FixJ family two-component response regulator
MDAHPVATGVDSTVFVIDDDHSMREALGRLFQSVGLQVQLFSSALELQNSALPDVASCLVLDVRLPGLSGFDLQAELAKSNIRIPIVFITGHGDIPMSVRAMKAGAIDFLSKPFRDQDLLDAVNQALERDRKRRIDERELADFHALYDALTPRQREVMAFVNRRTDEQASRGQARSERNQCENPSRRRHEEDGRQIVGGSGANSGGASDQGRNADLNLGMNIFLPRNQL